MARNLRDRPDCVRELLEESEEEDSESIFGDDTDSDPDFVFEDEQLDELNASEGDEVNISESGEIGVNKEVGGNENEERQRNRHLIRGRNKKTPYIWSTKEPERRGRVSERNLVMHLPGPKGAAKEVRMPENAFKLLIYDAMLQKITLRTNEEIDRQVSNVVRQSYHRNACKNEITAYIGLLYLAGVHKDSRRNLEELWSTDLGFYIYRATMSLPRFRFISTCLRFDDKTTRQERVREDRLAAIRNLWDRFVEHCCTYYTPYEICTIDEQLLGFRGRCGLGSTSNQNQTGMV